MPARPSGVQTVRLVAVLAASAAVLLGTGTAVARPTPSAPSPTPPRTPIVAGHTVDPRLSHRIADVTTQLATLARRNDRLDERYDVAVAVAAADQRAARQAQLDAEQARGRYQEAHDAFVVAVTQQYEAGTSPALGTLLTSRQPGSYLTGLDVAGYLSRQFAGTVSAVRAARADAVAADHRASAALVTARAQQLSLARQRDALIAQQQSFHRVLHSLTARQRREVAHARAVAAARARAARLAAQLAVGGDAVPAAVPLKNVPAAVRTVVSYAEAQVGKPYVFDTAGPGTFDCSGLTMAAYAQVGIGLPHSAAEQSGLGTPVRYDQLRPGDLIFLYHPIDHVEMYVGDDLAVSAADPALGVIYTRPSLDLADYAGAVRLLP